MLCFRYLLSIEINVRTTIVSYSAVMIVMIVNVTLHPMVHVQFSVFGTLSASNDSLQLSK